MKPDDGSYYFLWRGFVIRVRFDRIELSVVDDSRRDLVEQLERLGVWVREVDTAAGDFAPDHLHVLRSTQHPGITIVQEERPHRKTG